MTYKGRRPSGPCRSRAIRVLGRLKASCDYADRLELRGRLRVEVRTVARVYAVAGGGASPISIPVGGMVVNR
jgi:hypothetical protein